MPDLENILPENADKPKFPGKKFVMEIDRSGYAADGRGWTTLFIEQVMANTKYLEDTCNHIVPVHEGHPYYWADSTKQPTDGYATNFRIKDSDAVPGEVIIECDVYLDGSLLEAYEAGKLPKRSTETMYAGMTPEGKEVGPHLCGLGLFGTSPVALPDLKSRKDEKDSKGLISKLNSMISSLLEKVGLVNKSIEEGRMAEKYNLPEESLTAIQDGLKMASSGLSAINEAIKAILGEAPEGEADKPADDKDSKSLAEAQKRISELENAMKAQKSEAIKKERDEAFTRLHVQGKVTTQDRDVFDAIADSKGLSLAVATFEPRLGNAPKSAGAMNIPLNGIAGGDENAAMKQILKNNGVPDDQVDRYLARYNSIPLNLKTEVK